jgi:hypothetical protein
MQLFDAYFAVDWSAANGLRPKHPVKDAVWIGEQARANRTGETSQRQTNNIETYHRSREEGIEYLTSRLIHLVDAGQKVLVGFDFSFSFSAGLALALGLLERGRQPTGRKGGISPWQVIWAELARRITDSDSSSNNAVNNRFAAAGELNTIIGGGKKGSFWGCPKEKSVPGLEHRSPGFPFQASRGAVLKRFRLTEVRLPGTQETWKLYGAGSVGGQTLTGIPYLYRLRRTSRLGNISRVWPFETGFTPDPVCAAGPSPRNGPSIVYAEVWPGVVRERTRALLDADPSLIRDQAQVRSLCRWIAELDEQRRLSRLFDTPRGLNAAAVKVCIEEEGWALGAL